MQQSFHPVLTISITAAADLNDVRRFIGFDGNLCAAGAKALGTNNATFAAGEQASVDALGVVLVEAGNAIAAGAQVESDGDGRAIPLASGQAGGWALDTAQAAGDVIRILRGI